MHQVLDLLKAAHIKVPPASSSTFRSCSAGFQESDFQPPGYFFPDIVFCSSRGWQTGFGIVVKHERLRLDLLSLQVLQRMVNEGLSPAANYMGIEPLFCGFPLQCQASPIDHSPSGHELGNHMVIDAPAHKLTESEFESGAVVVGSAVFQADRAHHGV